MEQRKRIYYSAEQRTEIWDRWRRGESMSSSGGSIGSPRQCLGAVAVGWHSFGRT